MNIDINTQHGILCVNCPYNSEFVAAAKILGGRWNAPLWIFDPREEQKVRDLCYRVYGTDGIMEPDLLTIRAKFGPANDIRQASIEVFGRTIARAWGKDSGVKLGEGVVLSSGGFFSGGNAKHWETKAEPGTEVLITGIPRHRAEEMIKSGAKWLSIESDTLPVDHKVLKAERKRLVKRIAEIDARLSA